MILLSQNTWDKNNSKQYNKERREAENISQGTNPQTHRKRKLNRENLNTLFEIEFNT